ncbi:hypothetical protein HDU83_006384 [Entophlyctis luteolus]|nr:hypothetical protein HDU83_006384 [Entophlyctis luteolus]
MHSSADVVAASSASLYTSASSFSPSLHSASSAPPRLAVIVGDPPTAHPDALSRINRPKQSNDKANPDSRPETAASASEMMLWTVERLVDSNHTFAKPVYTFNKKTATWALRLLVLAHAHSSVDRFQSPAFSPDSALFLCAFPFASHSQPWGSFQITQFSVVRTVGTFASTSNSFLFVFDVSNTDEPDRVWRVATTSERDLAAWLDIIGHCIRRQRGPEPPPRHSSQKLMEPSVGKTAVTPARARASSDGVRPNHPQHVNPSPQLRTKLSTAFRPFALPAPPPYPSTAAAAPGTTAAPLFDATLSAPSASTTPQPSSSYSPSAPVSVLAAAQPSPPDSATSKPLPAALSHLLLDTLADAEARVTLDTYVRTVGVLRGGGNGSGGRQPYQHHKQQQQQGWHRERASTDAPAPQLSPIFRSPDSGSVDPAEWDATLRLRAMSLSAFHP